jgi:sec-independent protein translocase protein TatB
VFDIGFSEMMVIAVVALVVIGPERLPKVARTVGHMLGRMQRYVNDVKADINREIELDELRKFKQDFEKTASDFESSVRTEINRTEEALNATAREATASASAPPAAGGPGALPEYAPEHPLPTTPPAPTAPPPPLAAGEGAAPRA